MQQSLNQLQQQQQQTLLKFQQQHQMLSQQLAAGSPSVNSSTLMPTLTPQTVPQHLPPFSTLSSTTIASQSLGYPPSPASYLASLLDEQIDSDSSIQFHL